MDARLAFAFRVRVLTPFSQVNFIIGIQKAQYFAAFQFSDPKIINIYKGFTG